MSTIVRIIIQVLVDMHFINNIQSINGCRYHNHFVFKHEKMDSLRWHREFVIRMTYFGYSVEQTLVEDDTTFYVRFENQVPYDAALCEIFKVKLPE